MASLLPDIPTIADLFEALLGRNTRVVSTSPMRFGLRADYIVATYVDEAGEVKGVCVFDIPLAAYTGAALSMIPAGTAKDAARSGQLTDIIRENLHEVFNVTARFFHEVPADRLQTVHEQYPKVPKEIKQGFKAAKERLDLEVDVAGYGSGKASLFVF